MAHHRGTVALALALTAACSPGLNGQEHVLPADDRAAEIRVDDVYRLGGLEAEGWQAFQRIRDLGFDATGRLYVFDQGAAAVRVVARDGSLLRSLGGEGDGPGELSAGVGMAVAPDGTVLVEDLGRRSLAVFGPDGSYVRNVRPDRSRGRVSSFAVDGELRVVGLPPLAYAGRPGSSELRVRIPADGGGLQDPPGLPLVRTDLEDGEAEVLRWNWIPRREARNGAPRETAFLPAVRWALLPDGRVAVADSIEYRIHLVGAGNETVLRRRISVREVSGADRRAEIERRASQGGETVGGGGSVAGLGSTREQAGEAMMRQRRAQLEEDLAFHPEHQVVQGLRADPAGRIWVERVGEDPHAPGPVDVVTADGAYLGTLPEGSFTLPVAFGPDGLAVWLERDSLDVPVVRVRRVTIAGGT